MGDENESFYDNIILEGIRSDQEIPICRIKNTPNTPLIESTPYLPSTSSVNTIIKTKTRLRLKSYMDQEYDQALNHLKKEILNHIKQLFFNEKDKVNLK